MHNALHTEAHTLILRLRLYTDTCAYASEVHVISLHTCHVRPGPTRACVPRRVYTYLAACLSIYPCIDRYVSTYLLAANKLAS